MVSLVTPGGVSANTSTCLRFCECDRDLEQGPDLLRSQPSTHPCEPDLPESDLTNTRSNAARQGRVAAAEATGHRRTPQRAWGLQRPLSYSQLNGEKGRDDRDFDSCWQ